MITTVRGNAQNTQTGKIIIINISIREGKVKNPFFYQ
jgi:hypothetical protein